MKVQRVFHPNAVSIEGWQSLREAAKIMQEGPFGCLPVISGDDLVGIISERDLVEAIAEGEPLDVATVFEHMTESPRTVSPDDDCATAATEMLAVGCRHLPVVDDGHMVGVLSARDLLPLATPGVVEG